MSDLMEDIRVNLVLPGQAADSRKKALEVLAQACAPHLPYSAADLFSRLNEKENAAGAAIGEAVAVPHLKLARLYRPFKALMTFRSPVDFSAPDHKRVDLLCLVVSPDKDGPLHLRRLSRISRLLKNSDVASKIRTCEDAEAIKMLMASPEGWMLAA
ncbi:MAG: PTS sugar transporter subunit IIA [Alphaproteobacteria bacterium]|nr:PTS sugar transporter subunit IIA [Alphaproteobacteria bacterium]